MVYQKPGMSVERTLSAFHRLMASIYDEQNHLYVLHIDAKSDPALIKGLIEDFCSVRSNCLDIKPRNVAWAGLTTGEMMLALMHKGISHPKEQVPWEYFIRIGHESVPLVTLQYTEQMLDSYPRGTNFMQCWKVGGYDFFGQWENVNFKLEQVVVDSFNGTLMEGEHHVTSATRRVIPEDITFYKSVQTVVVSRDFVEYATKGPETHRILLYLANVKTSDEMLFPTILQSSPALRNTCVCDTSLHFVHWLRPGGSNHPEYLTLEHLPLLLAAPHLFARKFDLDDRRPHSGPSSGEEGVDKAAVVAGDDSKKTITTDWLAVGGTSGTLFQIVERFRREARNWYTLSGSVSVSVGGGEEAEEETAVFARRILCAQRTEGEIQMDASTAQRDSDTTGAEKGGAKASCLEWSLQREYHYRTHRLSSLLHSSWSYVENEMQWVVPPCLWYVLDSILLRDDVHDNLKALVMHSALGQSGCLDAALDLFLQAGGREAGADLLVSLGNKTELGATKCPPSSVMSLLDQVPLFFLSCFGFVWYCVHIIHIIYLCFLLN
jgi:hypothetical protein